MPALLAPPIHVRPAPAIEPPYDDGPSFVGMPALAQPPLPLDWSRVRAAETAAPTPPAGGGPRRPVSPGRGAAMHFLSLCLEVFNGRRPALHLRPLAGPAEFAGIAEQIARAMTRVPPPPAPRRIAVQRPPDGPRPTPRVQLRELRVCEPRPGVAEAAAVIGHDARAWALAVRLERRAAGWQCTLAHVI